MFWQINKWSGLLQERKTWRDKNDSPNVLKMPSLEETEMEPEVDPPGNTDPSTSLPFWRRAVTFMVAMAASTTAFNLYSFVVYLNDIKSYFHLTQSQGKTMPMS